MAMALKDLERKPASEAKSETRLQPSSAGKGDRDRRERCRRRGERDGLAGNAYLMQTVDSNMNADKARLNARCRTVAKPERRWPPDSIGHEAPTMHASADKKRRSHRRGPARKPRNMETSCRTPEKRRRKRS